MFYLFDVANTLIYKPELYSRIQEVINNNGIDIELDKIQYIHTILSNIEDFPDKTSKSFYEGFNKKLLYSLGIIPTEKLIEDIYKNCTGLKWEIFEDTEHLYKLDGKKGVITNFNSQVSNLLNDFFPNLFSYHLISEESIYRKPDIRFYKQAIDDLNNYKADIVYVGDSIRLDYEPASLLNIRSLLIDREDYFCNFPNRISSLYEL